MQSQYLYLDDLWECFGGGEGDRFLDECDRGGDTETLLERARRCLMEEDEIWVNNRCTNQCYSYLDFDDDDGDRDLDRLDLRYLSLSRSFSLSDEGDLLIFFDLRSLESISRLDDDDA